MHVDVKKFLKTKFCHVIWNIPKLFTLLVVFDQNFEKEPRNTLRKPFQYLSIIPSSLISLSLIPTAAGWDLKFFSYIVFVF